jgi:uncharacterized membrane protein
MTLQVRRLLAVVLGAVAVMTFAGFLLKAQCVGNYNELRDKNLCSNDIQVLYSIRGLQDRPFPYVNGELVDGQLVGGALEYPVLTGLFAWFPSLVVETDGGYLQATALLLAPFTFLTAWLLLKMVRWRALIYAAAPPLIWYSFHNWDLLVVCATVAAFYTWWQQRYAWAGCWVAVGSCLKLWPLFLVLPLLLDRLAAQDKDGARRSMVSFAGVFVLANAGFLIASPRGWWSPIQFQRERAADITSNSIWYWGYDGFTTDQLNVVVALLLIVGSTAAAAYGWRRAKREGVYPFLQVSGACLVLFMLTNKAHSPQYVLWLLPLFCLLQLRWGWWVGYIAIDMCLYVGLFRWYYDLSQGADFGLAKQALIVGIWGRTVMLVLLYVVMLRTQPAPELRLDDDDSRELPAAASRS